VLAAFSAGTPSAAADALALRETILGAADVGRERMADGIGLVLIAVLLVAVAGAVAWRRRRARAVLSPVAGPPIPATPMAHPIAAQPMAETASATLADQSAGPGVGPVEPPSDTGDAS
jgi:hypothetical protein